MLVDHGSNINSVWQDSTPIYLTIYNRDVESTIKMLKHGAEITNLQGKMSIIEFYDFLQNKASHLKCITKTEASEHQTKYSQIHYRVFSG